MKDAQTRFVSFMAQVRTVTAVVAGFVLAAAGPTGGHASAPARSSGAAQSAAELIGQKLVVRMTGKAPSASLLARARLGEIGGVIIHRDNINSATGLRSITSRLQQAAADGRSAAASDRGRPGRRARQDSVVDSAHALASADGNARLR